MVWHDGNYILDKHLTLRVCLFISFFCLSTVLPNTKYMIGSVKGPNVKHGSIPLGTLNKLLKIEVWADRLVRGLKFHVRRYSTKICTFSTTY